jgi:hypothetical protein
MMDDKQYKKVLELMRLSKEVCAFEFDGVIFKGYLPDSVKRYVESKESRSFYVWLHDTHVILSPSNNAKR